MGRKETYRQSAYAESVDPDDSGTYTENLVFVAMAFDISSELSDTYQAICRACSAEDLKAHRVDDEQDSGPIPVKILRGIEEAEFLVIDLTIERPNVYYELGYAHGVGNRSVEIALIAKAGTKIHFDIAHLGILFYESAIDLERKLVPRLKKMKRDSR
jgi:hypothetical protein